MVAVPIQWHQSMEWRFERRGLARFRLLRQRRERYGLECPKVVCSRAALARRSYGFCCAASPAVGGAFLLYRTAS